MTESQIAFFAALCAPFPRDQISSRTMDRGRATVHYVKPRRLMNRLDDVCGVDGWYPAYRATPHGFTCRLHLRVLDAQDQWVWAWKEDGGGREGMVRKVGDEMVSDSDNDEKSAYTNAFRRACMVWGLARYLYREGVPAYLEEIPAEFSPQPERDRPPPPERYPERYPDRTHDRPRDPDLSREPPPPAPGVASDNFRVPRSGRGAFAWAKALEAHYGVAVVKPMNQIAADMGLKGRIVDHNQEQIVALCWATIDQIKTWECYGGEFEHLEDPRHP